MRHQLKRLFCLMWVVAILGGQLPALASPFVYESDMEVAVAEQAAPVELTPFATPEVPTTATIGGYEYHVLTTPGHLAWMAVAGNAPVGRRFRLEADIVAPDNLRAVGAFAALLDGNGHTITVNSNLNAPTGGLFVTLGSTGIVRNLHITGIVAPSGGGNIVGGLVGTNNGTIENVHSSVHVTHVPGGGTITNFVGGLVATNNARIYNSQSSGQIRGENTTGGLVGQNVGTGTNQGEIINSFSTSSVIGLVSTGGLSGTNNGPNAVIEGSHAEGPVHGTNHVGGLVGQNQANALIEHSHALGNVQGGPNTGGLVGTNNSSRIVLCFARGNVVASSTVGGLVGQNINANAVIDQTFASGAVQGTGSGNHRTGGLVGFNNAGALITDSYARGNVTSIHTNAGALVGQNNSYITNTFATGNVFSSNNLVGGIQGGGNGSLSNSVALNTQLTQTFGANLTRRVSGSNSNLANNFAVEGMILNGAVFEDLLRPETLMDATTITDAQTRDRDFWENDAGFDFQDIWEWREGDEYHPVVLNMRGQVFITIHDLPSTTIPGQGVQLRYTISRTSGADYSQLEWILSGNTSPHTTLDQNGMLTIAYDESPGSVLTVLVRAVVNFNMAGVYDTIEFGTAATVVISGEFAIAANPNPLVFTPQTVGYSFADLDDRSMTVSIINAGNQPTGALSVSVDSTAGFGVRLAGGGTLLNSLTVASIPFGSTGSFVVTFPNGLPIGTHTGTITITGDNDLSETVLVSLVVMELEAWDISLSTTGLHTFPPAHVGYVALTPHTVTVTNTGNQPTGALSIEIFGVHAGDFTLSTTSLSSLGTIFDTTATFTVVPNTGLAIGTYTATVTVSGDHGISESFDITFAVTQVPVFSIVLAPGGNHDFGSLEVGYTAAPAAHSVTVTNDGNQPTGDLTIALSGTHASAFTLSATTIDGLAQGGSGSFTVQPNLGLAVGTYTATVTVSGANSISETFNVTFAVTLTPVHGISLTPSASHTFPGATLGYGAQTAHSVTIANTGNQPTGELTIALSGANATAFAVSTLTVPSLPVTGTDSTAIFTVVPNVGLAVGSYTAIVTVSGGHGISENFTVSFEVSPAPAFSIALNPAANHIFSAMEVGYLASPAALAVNITNTGNQPTGELTVSLSGENPGSFWLSSTTIPSIGLGGATATLYVQPLLGLAVGTHTAIVNITGDNGIAHTFTVTFVVEAVPVHGISIIPATDHDFGTLVMGYATAPAAYSVAIANTGNQPTGELTVGLSGDNSAHFLVSTSTISSLSPEGSPASFTIQPLVGLAVGTHTATVTVSGGNGISVAFDVSFTVLPILNPPIITLYNAPGGTVSMAYSFTFGATGDPTPAWAVTGGTLPNGLTLNPNGLLSGVPTLAGTFTFEVMVSNSEGYQTMTITVTITQPSGGNDNGGGNNPGDEGDEPIEDPTEAEDETQHSTGTRPPATTEPTTPPTTEDPLDLPPAPDIHVDTPPHPMFSQHHYSFMIGRPDGHIYPHAPITRAEAAAVFFRLLSDDTRIAMWHQENHFPDVNMGDWFHNEVSTMANMGIVRGLPSGDFVPHQAITRAEAVVMVARFFGEPTGGVANFTDITGHWAADYIHLLSHFNWLQGYEDGTFRPNQHITRAEFAALVNRMLNRVPESVEMLLPEATLWVDNRDPQAWYYLYLQEATHSTAFERLPSGFLRWTRILPHIDWSVFSHPNARPDDILVAEGDNSQ